MAHRHIIYMMLAEAAAQLRDEEALRRYAALLEELAARDNHRPYLAVASRDWGVACRLEGDYDEAGERLARAKALFEELELSWQLARTLVEMAELALAQSDRGAARDHFSQALHQFETLKAAPDVERTRAALRKL